MPRIFTYSYAPVRKNSVTQSVRNLYQGSFKCLVKFPEFSLMNIYYEVVRHYLITWSFLVVHLSILLAPHWDGKIRVDFFISSLPCRIRHSLYALALILLGDSMVSLSNMRAYF